MPRGTVKFFNGAKGFGFIAPDDGGADVFVHISALERSGLGGLNEGDMVGFELEQDRRSGKLAAVDLVVTGSAGPGARAPRSAGPPRSFGGGGGGGGDRDSFQRRPAGGGSSGGGGGGSRDPAGAGQGVVKWFNTTKGFGFIQPSDGGADVFVHISDVEKAGLSGLADGQALSYDLESDRRTGKTSATNLRVES
jgi:CspA family cold shock protein